MPARVSPTDRIRTKIDALFAEGRELPEIIEELARLGAQLLMQAALEAEVSEFLGRERYQRVATCPDAAAGARNGYRPATVKTITGAVTLERPKLRGTTEAFASRLFGKHVTKTNALETLVIASFVRGLSVRDVQASIAEALGDQAAISKSTVSEVCKAIRVEYQAWARRRLDDLTLDYLFLDASCFRMHPGSPAEPVLASWGITTGGKPVFVGLAPGAGESTDAWADFLTDLRDRGLATPLLIVSDGAKGLIAAIEQVFPQALRQRCVIHLLRNVLAKVPAGMQPEVRDAYWALFDTTDLTLEPGPPLVELVDGRSRTRNVGGSAATDSPRRRARASASRAGRPRAAISRWTSGSRYKSRFVAASNTFSGGARSTWETETTWSYVGRNSSRSRGSAMSSSSVSSWVTRARPVGPAARRRVVSLPSPASVSGTS